MNKQCGAGVVVGLLLLCLADGARPAGSLLPSAQSGYSVAPSTPPADFAPSTRVECFGNFHTMGVVVPFPQGSALEQKQRIECHLNRDGAWREVHPFARVGVTGYSATSVFWLRPDSTYQVKVTVRGEDGNVEHVWYGEGRTRPEPAIPAMPRELFVSPAGDDNVAGTREAPLRTVARAAQLVRPGTAIVLRDGVYYEGDLDLPIIDGNDTPIVVKAFPGEVPVFDASDAAYADPASWKQEGKGVFSRPLAGHCGFAALRQKASGDLIRMVRVPEREILFSRVYRALGTLEELGVEAAFHADGDRITILPPGPIGRYQIIIPKFTRAFDIHGNGNLIFEGLTFRFFGRGQYNTALFFQDTSDVLIQNCSFRYCNMYIWLKRDCHRVTVQDCDFYDRMDSWSFGMLKGSGGYHGEIEGGAVGTDGRYSGRGLVVRRNTIDGLFDGLHLCPHREDDAVTNETDVYQNVILNASDDFIETDGFTRNVRIFDNYMRVSLSGISLAQALDGPTFVLYNVIADQGLVRATQVEGYEGYPFKTNGGSGSDIGSGEVFFYHNSATTAGADSSAVLIKVARWWKFTLRNNVWTGLGKGLFTYRSDISPMDWDHDNLYAKEGPVALINYKTRYDSLAELTQARGYLPHGLSADPELRSPEQGDYSLSQTSPNIDRGIRVPGINDGRVLGVAPDIGAFEAR